MAEQIPIKTVQTNSFKMNYFQFGHGKEPLVILPGLSVQSVTPAAGAIAEAYRAWTDDYTVYVFDRRKELPAAYPIHEMARDTAEAFRALNLHAVSLFGASQGGMIAMVIAIEQPDLVKNLILGSTAASVNDIAYQTVETWIQAAKAGNAEALYLAFGEAVYPRETFEQARKHLISAAQSVTDEELNRFIILAESIRGFNVTDSLKKIACPVLVLGSTDDRVLGAGAAEQLAEGLTRHELYQYTGYGHAAYDTAPDYKERILHFLQGINH